MQKLIRGLFTAIMALVILVGVSAESKATVIFQDDFSGDAVDFSKWDQNYTASASIANGSLKLTEASDGTYIFASSSAFTLTSGSSYSLSFDYFLNLTDLSSTDQQNGYQHDSFSAAVTDPSFFNVKYGDVLPGTTTAANAWIHYTSNFTSDATELLVFALSSGDSTYDSYALIDNVRLESTDLQPVPEPSTFLLISAGGFGLIYVRRRV